MHGGPSPFGEGGYRLSLRYDGAPTTLLLEIPPIFTEYELLIGGVPTALTGSMVSVGVGSGNIVLELRTPNRSPYYSGLTYPPAIGTAATINRFFFIRTLVYAVSAWPR